MHLTPAGVPVAACALSSPSARQRFPPAHAPPPPPWPWPPPTTPPPSWPQPRCGSTIMEQLVSACPPQLARPPCPVQACVHLDTCCTLQLPTRRCAAHPNLRALPPPTPQEQKHQQQAERAALVAQDLRLCAELRKARATLKALHQSHRQAVRAAAGISVPPPQRLGRLNGPHLPRRRRRRLPGECCLPDGRPLRALPRCDKLSLTSPSRPLIWEAEGECVADTAAAFCAAGGPLHAHSTPQHRAGHGDGRRQVAAPRPAAEAARGCDVHPGGSGPAGQPADQGAGARRMRLPLPPRRAAAAGAAASPPPAARLSRAVGAAGDTPDFLVSTSCHWAHAAVDSPLQPQLRPGRQHCGRPHSIAVAARGRPRQ